MQHKHSGFFIDVCLNPADWNSNLCLPSNRYTSAHDIVPCDDYFSLHGDIFVLRKRSQVDFQRQTSMPSNPTLLDRRLLKTAQMKRKFATTSFLILLFLIALSQDI